MKDKKLQQYDIIVLLNVNFFFLFSSKGSERTTNKHSFLHRYCCIKLSTSSLATLLLQLLRFYTWDECEC